MMSVLERIRSRSVWDGQCLIWTGTKGKGYGQMRAGGKLLTVHRVVFESLHGAIPHGMMIDHTCRNRACVNPAHLQSVTNKQNQENRSSRTGNVTGIRGVTWRADRQKFRVRVVHNRHPHHGGYFDSVDEAAEVAVKLRNNLYTNNLTDK